MKTVHLQYFAILREQRGLDRETISTDAADAATLYGQLRKQHAFTLPADRLRVAINETFVPWPGPFAEGDTLVFIPPVAGG